MQTKKTLRSQIRPFFSLWYKRIRRSPVGTTGMIMFLAVLIVAVFAPWIATHDPMKIDITNRFTPPVFQDGGTWANILGTDQLGRDIWSQLAYGSRLSLQIGVLSVGFSFMIGVSLGLVAGWYGGIIDTILMRIVDVLQSIPSIVVLMALIAVLGPSVQTIIIVFSLTWWRTYSRIVRGETMQAKTIDYVQAARAVGVNDLRIMFKHIMPNVIQSSLALATVSVATVVMAESALSFLGLGPQDAVTWGRMVAYGREYVATSWWMAVLPGLAIAFTVLGIVFLGDWVRDILDPKLRGT